MPEASVIICAHNPRPAYLTRVLEALREQTLAFDKWELLLVDNASAEQLSGRIDLAWHPRGRHVREETLGLTPARLRGIVESKAELLVFIDDDNVVAPDFLEHAIAIGEKWPSLGAWGGSIEGEFDEPPPEWTRDFWAMLAIRPCPAPRWSNSPGDHESTPPGAGLCIRRGVALAYARDLERNQLRRQFDRKGESLISGGDYDLVMSCLDLGLGFGRFPGPKLRHLMPPERLTEDYLLRLTEGISCSNVLLGAARGRPVEIQRPGLERLLRDALLYWRKGRRAYRFLQAQRRGEAHAARLLVEASAAADNPMQPALNLPPAG